MKKGIVIVLSMVFLCMCVMSGCGEREMNDQAYLEDLSKALMARWDITDSNQESRDYFTSLADAELNILNPVSEYVFSDEQLETLAKEYEEALNNQKEGAKSFGSDDTTFTNLFLIKGYNQRARILGQIEELYGIPVADKYKSYKDDMVVLGKKVAAIEEILEQPLVLTHTGDSYEMVIENTSDYNLSSVQFNFQLLDEDGIVIDNEVAWLDNWSAGEKQKLSIYTYGVDFTSANMQMVMNLEGISTDYVGVECVDNMVVNLEIKDLPKEVSNVYGGKAYTSSIVNNITYEDNGWSDGKTYLELTFSGTKTYDQEGEDATNVVVFNYQILDENGTVVASGTVYSDALKTGDTYNNAKASTPYGIEPGTYSIVVEDNAD